MIAPDAPQLDVQPIDRHYFRKHGGAAYCGQGREGR